jgi:hypothetical protein
MPQNRKSGDSGSHHGLKKIAGNGECMENSRRRHQGPDQTEIELDEKGLKINRANASEPANLPFDLPAISGYVLSNLPMEQSGTPLRHVK